MDLTSDEDDDGGAVGGGDDDDTVCLANTWCVCPDNGSQYKSEILQEIEV